jgi:hypothetical protein
MSDTRIVAVNLCGVVLEVRSNYAPFIEFVASRLARIVVKDEPAEVHAELNWLREFPWGKKTPPIGTELPAVAINIHGSEHEVGIPSVPGFPGFSAKYDCQESLQVTGQLNYQVVWDSLRQRLGRFVANYFSTRLMYQMVYFPAAWHLGDSLNRFWFHGGAVECGGKALIIGGLAGIGKSTLLLRLMDDGEFAFVSDDLLFYDSEVVYACYEPVRLTSVSEAPAKLSAVGAIGDKPAFEVQHQVTDAVIPRMLVLPRFGDTTCIEELPSSAAAQRLYTSSRLAAQVAEFDYYATILSTFFGMDDWYPRQTQQLQDLLCDTACYALQMRRDDGPAKAYKILREAADGIF